MENLPAQMLPAVPNINVHLGHWVFNLAVPNIILWGIVIAALLLYFWLRLPKVFEPGIDKP
jgi:hypothetical protein